MKYVKYCLTLVNEFDDVVGLYQTFEKREDLYIYLGLIINKSPYSITINYLEYYDVEFDSFTQWVSRAICNNCILCVYTESGKRYKILVKSIQ